METVSIVAVDKTERFVNIQEEDSHHLDITDTVIWFYEADSYYDGDAPLPLGHLEGTLVNVADMNEDPLLVCDDIAADLGFIMAVAAPHVEHSLFYISRLYMNSEDNALRVMKAMPTILYKLMGCTPDLLVSFPEQHPEKQESDIASCDISRDTHDFFSKAGFVDTEGGVQLFKYSIPSDIEG